MPTPTKGRRLGGSPAHQRHMLANLATALFEHGRITTTQARARRLRPVAERLITFAKRGDLHARRQVLSTVTDRDVVHRLFTDIAPTFAAREGGYTRITKVGPRKGDNAPMAVVELVPEDVEARPRRRRARRTQPARPRRTATAAGSRTEAAEAPATQKPEPGDADDWADDDIDDEDTFDQEDTGADVQDADTDEEDTAADVQDADDQEDAEASAAEPGDDAGSDDEPAEDEPES